MKVYVVIGFSKESGYSLPSYLEVFATHEAAEQNAYKFEGFATVMIKEVRK